LLFFLEPGLTPENVTEPRHRHHHARFDDEVVGGEDEDEDQDEADDASIASNETFTLRERQAAINETHPFGIRIWKPAIYKKIRSVERNAEEDIHSTPGKTVSLTVWIGNLLWTSVFGIILYLACMAAYMCMRIFFWVKSSRDYSNVLYSLAHYLLFPFGSYVKLRLHEHYLHEDIGEGLSFAEYERWQAGDVEYGGLFFDPQRRSNTGGSNHPNQVSTLLFVS
jgi:Ca2+:H+ antiporter